MRNFQLMYCTSALWSFVYNKLGINIPTGTCLGLEDTDEVGDRVYTLALFSIR